MSKIKELLRMRIVQVAIFLGIVLVAFVLVWFQPQKAFIDQAVEEEMMPGDFQTLLAGDFIPIDHDVTGKAELLADLTTQERVIRLSEFETSNGPDLFVYLSPSPPDASNEDFAKNFVDLGRLKGNVGNQNYVVPEGTNFQTHSTVVIWCRRFTVAFAAAALTS